MRLRAMRAEDLTTVLALNNAAIPHVNELDGESMRDLLAKATVCAVAERLAGVAGAVIAFRPGAAYESANYRWFSDNYEDFLYVDRIIVSEDERGSGIGRAFYDRLWADEQPPRITCEVNEVPPNPGSMEFHRALGFEQVGSLTHDGGKTVTLLCCESSAPGRVA